MQTQIDILKIHFGSYEKVAAELGITSRHLQNIRNGKHIGRPIERLIKELIIKQTNQSESNHNNNSDPSNDI